MTNQNNRTKLAHINLSECQVPDDAAAWAEEYEEHRTILSEIHDIEIFNEILSTILRS